MRLLRQLIHALLIVLTLVVGASAAALIVSQTAWFKEWLRGYVVRQASHYLNGELSIARLGGNLFFGVEMEDIGISMDGNPVVTIKDLGVNYSVFDLISKGLTVDAIRLNQPVLYLRRDGDNWSIARLVKKQEQEADREGPAYPIAIDAIGISDASIVVDDPVGTTGVTVPRRFDRVDAALSFKYEPVRYSIDITHVSFRGSEPTIGLNALSGGVAVKDDTLYLDKLALRTEESSFSVDGAIQHYLSRPELNLRVSSDKTSLAELARLVPALEGIALQPAFEVQTSGPLDQLSVSMNLRSSAGQLTGTIVADLLAPGHSVRGDVSVRHLNLAPIVKDSRQQSDITANIHADLTADSLADRDSLRGRLSVDAPRVVAQGYAAEQIHGDVRLNGGHAAVDGRFAAYGTRATVKGDVTLAVPVAYDLRGRAEHVDLRRLPPALQVPVADTDVTADYHVRGTEPGSASDSARTVTADLRFDTSTIAGVRVGPGSTASVAVQGSDLSYSADADIANLDLQHIGTVFNLGALASDRYQGDITGHLTAHGSGTDPRTMTLTASGTLIESTVFGGRIPQVAFDAALADDSVHVKVEGGFSGFDPAALSGKPPLKGSVAGTLNVDATVRRLSEGVSPETVEASGRIDLTASTVGGLAIDHATLDGDYRDRAGEIRQLEIAGRDLNVLASGPVALGDDGDSRVTLHADTPSLQALGELFDVPVSGIAKVDATITGNRRELQATGTVVGNDASYGDTAALAISSNYTVRVPELDLERAHVQAATQATFLTVAGQSINEISAKTTYENKQVTFEATAKQPERTLDASGALLMHPDHQEVHLQRMAIATRGQQWQLAPESSATIKYADDSITVEHAQLVSGTQTITADGTFGRPGDALHIAMQNVELANVDALLLRAPQFTGHLDATGVVTGTTKQPHASAEFSVTAGGFRQFKYDSLTGTVDYTGPGLTVDARLQQNSTQWFTAKGYVPAAAFTTAEAQAAPADTTGDHVSAASPADAIDVTIDSSPIDLGIIQGFTTALADVTGTVEAHVKVTGSAADPHPTGTITLANGAATIVPLGVKYQQMSGRVDLEPDRVHVDRLTVVDNHKSELTVTGDLAVHAREVGAVQIRVISDDFKVIDNQMGSLRIKSDIAVTGELRSPHVEGSVAVTTGDVKLDEILALTGPSAYSTTPADSVPAEADALTARVSSPFDALTMNLRLRVPDDLVVKASSLQTPGSSVGLGALNVTLGGDLTATKQRGGPVQIVGAVNTIRGTYDFQGRRFEILRDGAIRFVGGDELNPRLDLRTRRIIQGVEARVNVTGTVREPSIQLSSSPPLEDADILSLIVFNQPINQLGEGQQISLAARAQSLAADAIVGQLAQSLGNLLELDTFEINLAPETGGGPEVTVGQQITKDLYLKVRQGIGDLNNTNVIFEYQLNDWLRLQSNVAQGASTQQSLFRREQSTGADLIFFFSY